MALSERCAPTDLIRHNQRYVKSPWKPKQDVFNANSEKSRKFVNLCYRQIAADCV